MTSGWEGWSCHGLTRGLLCCSCLQAPESAPSSDPIGPPFLEPAIPEAGCEENREHIVVDVLGADNLGFTLVEDDDPKQRRTICRSASSGSGRKWPRPKKKIPSLSSLPARRRTDARHLPVGEEVEPDMQVLDVGSGHSLLMPPVINLIPPTPSDVIDEDQFFDTNSEEESVEQMSSSESVDSVGSLGKGRAEVADPALQGEPQPGSQGYSTAAISQGEKGAKTEPQHGSRKPNVLRSAYQVAPLPEYPRKSSYYAEYPRKRSFNAGINLLQFTEHHLDDLSNQDMSRHELLKAELRLLPLGPRMEPLHHLRKPATRTCSLGDAVSRSHTFHSISNRADTDAQDQESPRQRRITIASYISQPEDQNIHFPREDRAGSKALLQLSTEGVCQWFSDLGLHQCHPYIRGASLNGSHIANIDQNILDLLHISAVEERERLLSAIYQELHPPDAVSQAVDKLLETIGQHDVEKFTAALVSMSRSKSSPNVDCVSSRSLFRDKGQNFNIQKTTQLVELTIHAMEQVVNLRTPKETTIGKVLDSCLKMLGLTESKDLYSLGTTEGLLNAFLVEKQIGDLLSPENRPLELTLFKKEPEVADRGVSASHHQSLQSKEEKVRELNQQMDLLQSVVDQVQELHQGLVSFYSELKNLESEPTAADKERQLEVALSRQQEAQLALQALQEGLRSTGSHKDRRSKSHLLDKMKLDCQIFKEEIRLIHLGRQVTRLQSAQQEEWDKERAHRKPVTLGQLASAHSTLVLVAAFETRSTQGQYGFTARYQEGRGLVVVHAQNSNLCLNDRLVEVNGVDVLDSGEEELTTLLHPQSSWIVILRKPPDVPPQGLAGGVPDPVAHGTTQGPEPPLEAPQSQEIIST